MAWIVKKKRLNKESGRKEIYYSLAWRDPVGCTTTRSLGFVGATEAKRMKTVLEGQHAQGLLVAPPPSARSSQPEPMPATPEALTLTALLDDLYLPTVERDRAPKTYAAAQTAAKAVKARLGHLRLTDIRFVVVDSYISARKKDGRKTRTIQLELRLLKAASKYAVRCDLLDELPDLPSVKDTDRKDMKALVRQLTPEKVVELLAELHPLDHQPHAVTRRHPPLNRDYLTYLVILMALNTGMRKSELLTRTWGDVDWSDGGMGSILVCPLPEVGFKPKTRRDRRIPLTPELRQELAEHHLQLGRPSKGWIFPSPRDAGKPRQDFSKALARASKAIGLPRLHAHALRHAWASRMAMAGVDRWTLMELGGWQSGEMLDEIYTHVTSAHMHEAMRGTGVGRARPEEPLANSARGITEAS
jgi:integrase